MRFSGSKSLRAKLLTFTCLSLAWAGLAVAQNTSDNAQPPASQATQPTTSDTALPSAPAPAAQTSKTEVSASQPQSTTPSYRFADYSKPKSHLFTLIGPYTPRTVPAPTFANSSRIDQIMQNGKVLLSLNDAIALALENNLDIAIARYNLPIADTDILRAKAGQQILGVSSGLVSGTPGGTGQGVTGGASSTGAQGGGAGGTTTAAGGAGTGAGGLTETTLGLGPLVPSYDPILTGNMFLEHSSTPTSSPFSGGVPLVINNYGTANFNYNQGFASGTTLQVGFNNQRVTTNNLFSTVSPQLTSGFRATLTQHLLQGFSPSSNLRLIHIAKNDREISDVGFRLQVITTVAQIQNIYWDLVNAFEDVKVKQEALALAQKTLGDNQKQVQIGTLAPIEVTRARSQVASANQDLIVSQTNLQLQQLLMKNAISRNLTDQQLAAAPVIPTDTMELPAVEPVVPTEDLVSDALAHRPELAQSRIDLMNRDISRKALKNSLLPTVDLYAFYGASALGGDQNAAATCGNPNLPAAFANFCTPAGTFRGDGYGGAVSNLFNSSAPDKGAGIQVNIPIRNRAAQALQVRSELEYRQAQMHLEQQQNQIRIEVRNAQFAVQQNRARVDAAKDAVALARESLTAEQKKYALGASTTTLVLSSQSSLTQAQSNLISATTAYEKSRVELDRVTGLLLSHNGIEIADAVSGQVKSLPTVPGVVKRSDVDQLTPAVGQQPPVTNGPAAPITPAPQQNPQTGAPEPR